MKTDIVLRSFSRDFDWLGYALKSIRKHCHGFNKLIVDIPRKDEKEFMDRGFEVDKLVMVDEPAGDTYKWQQCRKMNAHEYSDADFVLFSDSDAVFIRECSPEMFFVNSKPYMLITPYTVLGDAVPWQPIVEKALKIKCPYETMRRLPFFVARNMIGQCKNYIGMIQKMPMESYVMSQPHHAFSEFNALGSFIFQFYPDSMYWWDTEKEPNLPQPFVKQNWSWGGLKPEIEAELKVLTS